MFESICRHNNSASSDWDFAEPKKFPCQGGIYTFGDTARHNKRLTIGTYNPES